jgi:ribonuclease HI
MITAHLDGGCWKNPGGPAAAACVIFRNGHAVYRMTKVFPEHPNMTNNVAEFEGMKLILEWLLDNYISEHCHIISDSQIVINRMNGKSKKAPVGACAKVASQCLSLYMDQERKITFEWKPRRHNFECDQMCDRAMLQYLRQSKIPSYMNDDKGFRYGSEPL